jgi:hypothetical protein
MKKFTTVRDAKEFLVSRIVTQAQRESVPLSEVEEKMLYFSETAWTLPDIAEVNDAFDRDYNQVKYEQKIGMLIRNFLDETRKNNRDEFEAWKEAVRTIRQEDHYLLVLIAAADASPSMSGGRFLKLLALAFVAACVILAIGYLFLKR